MGLISYLQEAPLLGEVYAGEASPSRRGQGKVVLVANPDSPPGTSEAGSQVDRLSSMHLLEQDQGGMRIGAGDPARAQWEVPSIPTADHSPFGLA